jgi:hypothetical protein
MKVMLDECITRRCADAISDYLKLSGIESHFLIDFMGAQGALDVQWTQLLQPPADWIVITGDSGSGSPRAHAKGPPLHLILPRHGITGFFLWGKSLTQCTGAEKARIVIAKMPEAWSSAPGR